MNKKALLKACCAWAAVEFGVRIDEIMSSLRKPRVVQARWAVMGLLRQRGYSHSEIGRLLDRDHTTVMHGVDRSANLGVDYPACLKAIESSLERGYINRHVVRGSS